MGVTDSLEEVDLELGADVAWDAGQELPGVLEGQDRFAVCEPAGRVLRARDRVANRLRVLARKYVKLKSDGATAFSR